LKHWEHSVHDVLNSSIVGYVQLLTGVAVFLARVRPFLCVGGDLRDLHGLSILRFELNATVSDEVRTLNSELTPKKASFSSLKSALQLEQISIL
jgi:hypothetical protein